MKVMNNIKPDYEMKVLMLGDCAVGKSCILMQYVAHIFIKTFITTIGIDFRIKMLKVDSQYVKLQIWDTAGQERFRTLTCSYYRGCQAIIIVYAINDRSSFNSITNWIEQIKLHADEDVALLLVGNKSDLEADRVVSYEEGELLAKQYNIPFLETSAENGKNIDLAFETVVKEVIERKNRSVSEEKTEIKPTRSSPLRTKQCC